MICFDRYDAINPISISDSANLIAPFAQGEILRLKHIVYKPTSESAFQSVLYI